MLAPWEKSYDHSRQCIKKQRHYFANKGPSSQVYGFSSSHVWMWELDYRESWVLKNWGAFELWSWRRLLRVPWTARKSNQSIIKEINPECLLEGLMLKLKLQNFGHLMWRADSFEKTLMLGKIEGKRRRGWQKMRWLDGILDSMDMSLSKPGSWWWTGRPGVLQSMASQSQTWLSNWTELTEWLASIHMPTVYLSCYSICPNHLPADFFLSCVYFANIYYLKIFLLVCHLSCHSLNNAFQRAESLNFNEVQFIDLYFCGSCFWHHM